MKKIFFVYLLLLVISSCKSVTQVTESISNKTNEIQVNINLIDIKEDKVFVTVNAPLITSDEITFSFPRMIPGAYSDDNYGKFIEAFKAYDKKGNELKSKKINANSWEISNSKSLDKITYLVNDTFDIEKKSDFGKDDIFSPTGSNIDVGKNIMLNTHCFIGYFKDFVGNPYKVNISHPDDFWGATSMADVDSSTTNDLFLMPSYSELVENPILYSKPNFSTFSVDEMEILIAVYSPTGKFTAESITPAMKNMIIAQKQFLGKMNTTKKYTILLYLSSLKNDANGFGALEHPTSTTVVLPETYSQEVLIENMKDVVSHEFFHIVTPLTIHSEEIQNFDYDDPKMSKHLWLYEGVTEYFSNLFQINQGLISEAEFYARIVQKIWQANKMDDTMPFTTMSTNVLKNPYKDQYLNVYEKGALIGMCIDIIIREKSNGKKGILDLMQKLSSEYGVTKAFKDDELFQKITDLTYPEVGVFLNTFVSGPMPIPYADYLAKVGVEETKVKILGNIFKKKGKEYISITNNTNEIIVNSKIKLNVFFTNLGLVWGDIIMAINNKEYTPDKVNEILYDCDNWNENDAITLKIRRKDAEIIINGTVKLPFEERDGLKALNTSKTALKEFWLKG
jgi:predicted metalloprotease with PDZ domain